MIDFHTSEQSKGVVISNSLLSCTSNSIMMLVDAQDIQHIVSSIHDHIQGIIIQILIQHFLRVK